jgi:hypothetical protein
MTPRGSLFEADVPDGFHYRDDFITRDEETRLAEEVAGVEFSNFEMRGVVARRRVAFFGKPYDSGTAVSVRHSSRPRRPDPEDDSRDHTRTAVRVSDDRKFEERVRAPHSGRDQTPLFDYVSHGSILSHGFRGFHITSAALSQVNQ